MTSLSNAKAPFGQNVPYRSGDLLAMAVWFGLAAGLLEGLLFLVFQEAGWLGWLQRIRPVDLDILWVSPLTDVLLFLAVAIPLLPVCWSLRKRNWWGLAIVAYATLLFYALMGVGGQFSERGQLVFALGLGTVTSRWLSRDAARCMVFFRRTAWGLAGIAVLLFLGVHTAAPAWEKVRHSRLPEAKKDAPNVLLIVLDTLRADRLGSYGYARPTTPFLDEFAKHAVQFDEAFANASWTVTSHASMFTGLLPYEHGALRDPLPSKYTTLAEILSARGYATAGVVANSTACTRSFGLAQGFQHWENLFTGPFDSFGRTSYGRKIRKYAFRYVAYHGRMEGMIGAEVTQRALQWLDQRSDRPFFVFLNYMDTHVPYLPPSEQAARFSSTPEKIAPARKFRLRPRGKVDEAERKRLANEAYDAALAYLDSQLRVLWEGIERRGLDRNLLVIITSDHGESLGEHGIYEHFNSLYLEQIRVPLFIHFAGKVPAGVKASGIVSLHQMAATVLSLVGIAPDSWMGPSMEAHWSGTPHDDPPVFSEIPSAKGFPGVIAIEPVAKGWVKALATSEWHYVLQEDGKVELYRWKTDPEELQNLASEAEHQKLVQHFRSLLQATGEAKRAVAEVGSASYPKN